MNEEQKELYAKLTPLQQHTANGHLKGWTNEKSYLQACKKTKREPAKNPRSAANQILTNTNVKAYVESCKKSIAESDVDNTIMTREEALRRLTVIARGKTLAQFKNVEIPILIGKKAGDEDDEHWGSEERTIWNIPDAENLTDEQLQTIQEVTATKEGPKIKQYSPTEAIKLMCEMEGWKQGDDDNQPITIIINGKEAML